MNARSYILYFTNSGSLSGIASIILNQLFLISRFYIEALIQTDTCRNALLKRVDTLIEYFETYCKYEFRGASVLFIGK